MSPAVKIVAPGNCASRLAVMPEPGLPQLMISPAPISSIWAGVGVTSGVEVSTGVGVSVIVAVGTGGLVSVGARVTVAVGGGVGAGLHAPRTTPNIRQAARVFNRRTTFLDLDR